MQNEAKQEANLKLKQASGVVKEETGHKPPMHLRQGNIIEELFSLMEEEKNINVLVLATNTDDNGPGPIISALTNKEYTRLRIPIMIVPGKFTKDQISQIS